MSKSQRLISKRFDQIGELYSGATPSTAKSEYWEGDIVWITPNDLSRLRTPFLESSQKMLTAKGLRSCSAYILPAGSVVISSRAPIGYLAVSKVDYCTNQGCKSILLKEGYDSLYIYYNILHNIDKVKRVGEGTTFAEISKSALANIEFDYIVNTKAQSKIAKILNTVDQAIEQTEAIITKQQRIKTGLMQDLLTKGIDENGNIRSEETHEFKDSPLGRIPVEWTPHLLRDVGIWKSGGTPSKSEPKYWDGNMPWVCPKDMKCFDLGRTIDTITPLGARTGSKVVPRDTVMIVVRGMILAHTFPVSITRSDMAFNQDIKAIIPFEFISGRFLAYWFYSNGSQLLKIVTTATHGTKRFDINDLHDVSIAIPDGYEQEKICEIIDQSSLLISQCEEQLFKLQSLKTALMQDLLTGDVSVANLLDEQSTI